MSEIGENFRGTVKHVKKGGHDLVHVLGISTLLALAAAGAAETGTGNGATSRHTTRHELSEPTPVRHHHRVHARAEESDDSLVGDVKGVFQGLGEIVEGGAEVAGDIGHAAIHPLTGRRTHGKISNAESKRLTAHAEWEANGRIGQEP